MRHWKETGLLVTVILIVLLSFVPPASAAECGVAEKDSGSYGTLPGGGSYGLPVASINLSEWSSYSGAYDAERYDGSGTITYDAYVGGGAWSYGTSGNANRGTGIVAHVDLSTWSVTEDASC